MTREIVAVDLFAGAGGFSEGLSQACEDLGYDLYEAAINHWEPAIETHEANHPDAHQYHSKVEQLHPPEVVRRLTGQDTPDVDLLVGGPECTHFSRARGGKPVSEQKRMSPWHILDWLEKLNVDAFVIENVPEIQDWGPVDEDGQPVRDGSIFDAWVNALNQLGYAVDWTQLVAADYGDPTTRERFFIIGRQAGSVTFPEPTHSEVDDELPNHRTAAEIIDWSDLGGSIWTRDLNDGRMTPPKNSTMRRIAEGLRRHCGDAIGLFADVLETLGRDEIRRLREERIVPQRHAAAVADAVDEPFLVPAASRATVAPWILKHKKNSPSQDVTTPLHTVHANGNHFALGTASTHLLRQQDGAHPIDVQDTAVPTIATRGGHAIATTETLLMPKNGRNRGLHSNGLYRPDDRPAHTITADPRAKLVTPVVQPFVDDYEGPAKAVSQPLGTVTSRDRFALVVPELWPWGLDVRYRMLQPRELKRAQGFPADYEIVGTKTDRTSQIGNAVPVNLAKSLCKHVLTATDPSLATYGGGLGEDPDAEIPTYEEVAGDD
ncbi:DNA cytosine methyltransferase [Halobellus sp. Atlit-38R]|uniref:DNA cytosine methyltransferase n=1 Tax=Halobellus sp. Atlit-38R TaxID=2282131 RepID=UPI000EF1ECBF|nr:DNA cytosine methyltransferase [Halobellus sp. Atlit-38R]RLM88163.1 DNA cytosine methyltransferase [Halobellus sp. Atlit-38R]